MALAVIGLALVTLAIAGSIRRPLPARYANFEEVGRRLGGVAVRDTCIFWIGHVPASLKAAPYWGTVLETQAAAPGRLKIGPRSHVNRLPAIDPIRRRFGIRPIPTGDAAFDERFLVEGGPAEWVTAVLTPEARARIAALEALGRVDVESGPHGTTVSCTRDLAENLEALWTFVREAEPLRNLLVRDLPAGVEILSVETHGRGGRCPVCRSPLEGALVHCRRCRTAHHDECWRYVGGCSRYGCGDLRARAG